MGFERPTSGAPPRDAIRRRRAIALLVAAGIGVLGAAASAQPNEPAHVVELPAASASLAPSAPPAAASASAASSAAEPAPSASAAPAPAPVPAPAASAPTTAPSAPPPASSAPLVLAPGESVTLHDRDVFVIRRPYGGKTAEARARAASQAIERAVDDKGATEPRVEQTGDVAVVFVGAVPVVQLTADDATAAGDVSLAVHAASVSAKVRDALRSERHRNALAKGVFSFSLLVFSGLVALLILRKLGELSERARAYIEANPERVPGLRVQSIEVVRPPTLRGGLSIGLTLARWLAQVALAYGWLVFALSLFESTRRYTDRLTALVLAPLSSLVGRVGSALPMLVVFAIAAVAVGALVRFAGIFFAGVARGETRVAWLPADLARPTGIVVRAGIVVAAFAFAGPLVTGSYDGALARTATVVLVALGLSCTPLLASVAAGLPIVYGRRLRPGDHAEIGERRGRVRDVGLVDVALEDEQGAEVRVPHLLGLVRATRILGRAPIVAAVVVVDAAVPQSRVRDVLVSAARSCGSRASAELERLSADGALWRVTVALDGVASRADFPLALADALSREGIGLGRAPEGAGRA